MCTLENWGEKHLSQCLVTCASNNHCIVLLDNFDLLNENVLKKHHPDLIEYMKV